VQTYHSKATAQKILDEWNTRFSNRDLERAELPAFSAGTLQTADLVTVVWTAYRQAFNVQKSRSEASRLIKQGSVELDGTKIRDPKASITPKAGQILRLDKKHAVRIA
jgi:tyrosyl-tRNA synthetase